MKKILNSPGILLIFLGVASCGDSGGPRGLPSEADETYGGAATSAQSTDEDVPDEAGACAAFCQKSVDCEIQGQVEQCNQECLEYFNEIPAENVACKSATIDFVACRRELPCSELAMDSGCGAEYEQVEQACPKM